MKYKTELHCHTEYVSRFCATVDAQDIVEQYLEFGYTSIVITDHMSERIFSPEEIAPLSQRDKMDYYLSGYRKVKEYADKRAGDKLNVLLGAEICFPNTHTDYLIYGGDEDFFLNNADMYLHERYWTGSLCHHNDLLFIQAHPFRIGCAVTEDWVIDGIEVYNGHPWQDNHNRIAEEWLKEYPDYIATSGSDHHIHEGLPNSGIITDFPITSNAELLKVLKSREYELIRDEETRELARKLHKE